MPNKRHGYSLQCLTCHQKRGGGGFEDPKQFARVLQNSQKEHFGHDYKIKQTYHAAELGHTNVEQTSAQTITNTTYSDISGTTIANTDFVASKKYLIFVSAVVDSSVSITTALQFRVLHGTTAFTDSEHKVVPVSSAGNREHYQWWTVWNAISGEGIKMQTSNSGAGFTSRADQISIIAIKLDDDFTQGTEYDFQETSASTSLATSDSTTNNAARTTTPAAANTPIMVLSKSRITVAATTRDVGSRIARSGEATDNNTFCQVEGRSTTLETYVECNAAVFNCGAVSNTFTEKSFSTTASSGTRTTSGIFWIDLNKLRNNNYSFANGSVTDLSAASNYATQLATCSITPDVTGDVWVFGYTTFDANAQNQGWKARLQVDNSDAPGTQTSDAYNNTASHDTIDELPFTMQSMFQGMTSGSSHTIDLDASTSAATAGRGCRTKTVFAVTMELPSTGIAQKFVVGENVDVTEAKQFHAARVAQRNETITVTEARQFFAARLFRLSETLTVAEQTITAAARWIQANEVLTVLDQFQYLRGRKFEVAEVITLTEQISTFAQRRITIPETLTILDAVISKSDRRFQIAENLVATEQFIPASARKIQANEIITVTEASPITKADRVMQQGESLNLTESILQPIRGRLMQLQENLTVTEADILARGIVFTVAESIQLTEQYNSLAARSFVISELAAISEQPLTKAERKFTVQEALDLSEQLITAAARLMPVAELTSVQELIETYAARKFEVNQPLGITENVLAIIRPEGVSRLFQVEENTNLTEATPIFRKGLLLAIQEDVGLLETLITLGQRQFQVNESAIITEILTTLRQVKMLIAENTTVTDSTPIFLRAANMVIAEVMDVSETVLSYRGKLFLVSEAMSVLEEVITKLEEDVGPPPGSFVTVFGAPQKQRRRRRTTTIQEYKPKQKVELLKELPQPRIVVVKDYDFIYNIEAPAPSARALLQQLEIDALRDKYANVLPPVPLEFPRRKHFVTRDYAFSYSINQLVTRDYDFSYDVRQLIEKDVVFSYDVRAINWNLIASIRKKKAEIEALDSLELVESQQTT